MRLIDCEQGSPEWLQAKKGLITGTRIEQAFKQSDALKNKLLAERMATFIEQDQTSKDMDRGNALEPIACREYEKETGYKVEHVGLVLHPHREDIGLSPDGIIDGGRKAVEFKCPKPETHIEYMRGEKAPKKYLFQLLGYFLTLHDLESIDFVSFDELNEVKPLHIMTLTLDDLLNVEYLKGKKVGSIDNLQEKIFAFADSVDAEYNRLIF